jgi:hypothetical protein
VSQRNDERKIKAAQNSKQAEKIGYVPRNKQASSMTASGLSSAGMMGKGRNDPDQVQYELTYTDCGLHLLWTTLTVDCTCMCMSDESDMTAVR